jgi:hypothetical protein
MYRPLYIGRPVTLTIESMLNSNTRAILWDHRDEKAIECFINLQGRYFRNEALESVNSFLRCILPTK